MRNDGRRRKGKAATVALAIGLSLLGPAGHAQTIAILDGCVTRRLEDLPDNVTLRQAGDWILNAKSILRNECGVPVHVTYGPWVEDQQIGRFYYKVDLAPGQTFTTDSWSGLLRAIACPAAPIPGHPTGYRLAYRDRPNEPIGRVEKMSSLVCIPGS